MAIYSAYLLIELFPDKVCILTSNMLSNYSQTSMNVRVIRVPMALVVINLIGTRALAMLAGQEQIATKVRKFLR